MEPPFIPWPPCPLTVAETWLEARAGIESAHGPLPVRVLDAVAYPDLRGSWLAARCLFAWPPYRCMCGAIFAGPCAISGDSNPMRCGTPLAKTSTHPIEHVRRRV